MLSMVCRYTLTYEYENGRKQERTHTAHGKKGPVTTDVRIKRWKESEREKENYPKVSGFGRHALFRSLVEHFTLRKHILFLVFPSL